MKYTTDIGVWLNEGAEDYLPRNISVFETKEAAELLFDGISVAIRTPRGATVLTADRKAAYYVEGVIRTANAKLRRAERAREAPKSDTTEKIARERSHRISAIIRERAPSIIPTEPPKQPKGERALFIMDEAADLKPSDFPEPPSAGEPVPMTKEQHEEAIRALARALGLS